MARTTKCVYFDVCVCVTGSTFAKGRYVAYIFSVKINFKGPCVQVAGLRTCLLLIPSQLANAIKMETL